MFNISNHPILFNTPSSIVKSSWTEHVPFAFFLIDFLRPEIFAELGVHNGNSFHAFCQTVKTLNLNTKCYGIDTWKGDEQAGYYGDEVFEELSKYHDLHYKSFAELLRTTFDEANTAFKEKSIDLLHIDGLHTYEAVKHDFETWLPKMSEKGVVIFHDTQVVEEDFGVYKFWEEVKGKYPSFEFKHGFGLGVLATGKSVDKDFLEFLQQANKNDFFQKQFAFIGKKIVENDILHEKDNHIYNLGTIIENQKKDIENQKKDIENQKKDIEKQKKEKDAADVDLHQKNKLIKLKDDHIHNLGAIIEQLKEYRERRRFKNRLKRLGRKLTPRFLRKLIDKNKNKTGYHQGISETDIKIIQSNVKNFLYKPLISVIIPVYNVDPQWLQLAIDSVKNQLYEKWEICIADDFSTNQETIKYLKSIKESKIKIKFLQKNVNISQSSNEALKLAKGDYVALLDHDDELTRDALYEVVKAINETQADLIYSDEDKVDMQAKYNSPHFKPDYSPDQLLSQNYICHLAVYKTTIIKQIGGFRKGFEGSQDYDLVLRFVEKTDKIYHIPKVLYHWRMLPESTASEFNSKSYANEAGRKAVEEALQRRNIKGQALLGEVPGIYQVKREIIGDPLVSIIIPFKDKTELLKCCLDSILKKSSYKNFEVIGISNNSVDPQTAITIQEYEKLDQRIKFYENNNPFNYSQLNNYGVSIAKGSHLILLNNDIEIITPDWIERLLEHSQREEVGVVGAKLYYPNDTLQHGGVIIGISGLAGHSHKYFKRSDFGYFSRLFIIQNLSALTGACLMVKKSIYQEVNGLNEKELKIAFNDVDFCLRVREKGYLNVFTPFCEAYHHESVSRGFENTPEKVERFNSEVTYMQNRHREILKRGDPYYNPNLTLNKEDFSY
jgi:glycosyltransferase involved in cell wall biosynthesis